jgi:preprotein translocase subunit SecD
MTRGLQWRIALGVVVLAGCFVLLYPSLGPVPAFWAEYLPSSPIRLGLDLQGGLYLLLEVERDKAVEAVVDQTIQEASTRMKHEMIRYTDIERTSAAGFSVYLKDAEQASLFDEKALGRLVNFKKTGSASSQKGFEVQLQMDPKYVEAIKERAEQQAVEIIRNRIDAFGVTEPNVARQGSGQIVVHLPGLRKDTDRAIDIIKRTARLEFKIVDEQADIAAAERGEVPPDDQLLYQSKRDPDTG